MSTHTDVTATNPAQPPKHFLTVDDLSAGPSSDRYRFASNELLHACLDLTVLHYQETTEVRDDGRRSANARALARKTTGTRQSYPAVREP